MNRGMKYDKIGDDAGGRRPTTKGSWYSGEWEVFNWEEGQGLIMEILAPEHC